MTKTQVIALLRKNKDDRGQASWKKLGQPLKSFGIGLTQLRKLAKQIGRDHDLALDLWTNEYYDARVIGALIDEPKKMTREQAEAQIDDVHLGMLAHVYCSCDAALAKAEIATELAVDWAESKDDVRRRCGYLLFYELSKNKKNPALNDTFFRKYVDRIQESIHDEENWVRDAMNTALLGIGKRSLALNKAVIRAAKKIGPVEVDYGDNSCKAPDILQHMTSPALQKRLGGQAAAVLGTTAARIKE